MSSLPRPAIILRHPRSPVALLHRDELAAGPTPDSIASALAHQQAERARVAVMGVIFADPDGTGALVAVALRERA